MASLCLNNPPRLSITGTLEKAFGKKTHKKIGMHWILFLPDIRPAGYPANL
jgi:hypothetical protein